MTDNVFVNLCSATYVVLGETVVEVVPTPD